MAPKLPKLDKNKRVKAIARERVGSPKPSRPIPAKTDEAAAKPRRKKNWVDEAEL